MIERYSRPKMKQVWSDTNKYDKWLDVELAACEAWTEHGVIPESDMEKLREANYDIEKLNQILEVTKHDMTAFLQSVTGSLGDEGRWIHLGMTTSDVWDTSTSLLLIEASKLIQEELDLVIDSLRKKAIEYKDTLMMGRTHGIHAEPITFGLKIALWLEEMKRNKKRLEDAIEQISVGKISGPVGTNATVPPSVESVACQKLGISPAPISNQIIQRDRHAQFITTISVIASSLEKFATEIRSLQRTEIREVEEPFGKGQTGSSSMPHKRNPELSERICGLARLIRGYAITSLENVALWGERDISHSSAERVIIADCCFAIDYILSLFSNVMNGLKVYTDRMYENLESTKGILFSQRILLTLIEKGISREDAYKIVQTHSMKCWDEGKDFRESIRTDDSLSQYFSSKDLDEIFDYKYYTRFVDEIYQRVDLDKV